MTFTLVFIDSVLEIYVKCGLFIRKCLFIQTIIINLLNEFNAFLFVSNGAIICQMLRSLCFYPCLVLQNAMDWGPPGSSVHRILQARILERVAIPFSRGSSDPGIEPGSLHYRQILYCLSHQGSPDYSQIVAKRNVFMWNIALKAQTQGSSRTLL